MEWPHDQSKVSTQHQKEVVKAIVVDLGGVLFAEGSSEAADVLSRRYGYDKNVVLGVFRSHESIALRKGLISDEEFWAWAQSSLPVLFDNQWYLFWTRVGDTPERILVSKLQTEGDLHDWRIDDAVEVHRARRDWEGGNLPAAATRYGGIMQRVNQLRDPAIFQEDGRIYLLYAIAGELTPPSPAGCD